MPKLRINPVQTFLLQSGGKRRRWIAFKPQAERTRSKQWKYLPGWFKGAAKQITTPQLTARLWPHTLHRFTATSGASIAHPPTSRLNWNQAAVFICRDLFPRVLQRKQQVVESPSSMILRQAEGMQVWRAAAQAPEGFTEKPTCKLQETVKLTSK